MSDNRVREQTLRPTKRPRRSSSYASANKNTVIMERQRTIGTRWREEEKEERGGGGRYTSKIIAKNR